MSALADRVEGRDVLHRHNRAMSVIDRVDDADARWVLLDYVLRGSPAIDAAILAQRRDRSLRPGRQAEVVRLRDEEHLTFKEIADRLGYAADSGAWHMYRQAGGHVHLRSVA